jgi:hypothetical protein
MSKPKVYGDSVDVSDGMTASRHKRVIDAEISAKAVLRELDPALADHRFDLVDGHFKAKDDALRGLALLRDRQEIAENLGPTGPVVEPTSMHFVVWSAAAKLWDDGHFSQARFNAPQRS